MTAYTEYVKRRMGELSSEDMPPKDKIKMIAQEWREGTGKEKKSSPKKTSESRAKKGGSMLQGGGKKKPTSKKGGSMLQGGGSKKMAVDSSCGCKKKATKGGNMMGEGAVFLDNGVQLHPEMMGAGFFSGSFEDVMSDLWTGFTLPFKAISKVASSPAGRIATLAAPFLL